MSVRAAALLPFLLLLPTLASAAPEKVVVLPLKAKLGVKAALAEVVNDAFVAALQSRGVQVVTQRDVENMLKLEQKKAELNVKVAARMGEEACSADSSCLAEIGGALGATYLISGSLSKLGASLQFTAELIDQRKAVVARRFHQISRKGGDDAYLELAQQAAVVLFPGSGAGADVRSEVSFGTGVRIAVPTIDLDDDGAPGLQGLNIEAEKRLEAALDAQDRKDSAEVVQEAWCSLASLVKNNPYLKKARKACDGWGKYVEAEKALEKDHASLVAYLELKRKSDEQKLAVVNAFLATYGGVTSRQEVAWALEMKRQLEPAPAAPEPPAGVEDREDPVRPGSSSAWRAPIETGCKVGDSRCAEDERTGVALVLLRGGSFTAGCIVGDPDCRENEKPPRQVEVGAFRLMKTEVTVAAYLRCVKAGACSETLKFESSTAGACNWKHGRMDHPMNCLSWEDAAAFCRWAGGRLPTGDEWEFAARDGRSVVYPWGNDRVEGTRANYCDAKCPKGWADASQDDQFSETAPVGSYATGGTPSGLLDMAGNVWEWVDTSQGDKVEIRGGGWFGKAPFLRASYREKYSPEVRSPYVGFRCAL